MMMKSFGALSFMSKLILGAAFLSSALADESARKKMSKNEIRVEAEFNSTKTICVGRLLIDVPVETEVVYGPAWVLADIERYPGEAKKIDLAVDDSVGNVEKNRFLATGDLAGPNSMLGKIVEEGANKVVFSMSSGSEYKLEAFAPRGDDLFMLSLLSWEKGKQYDDLRELTDVVNRLSPRMDGVIPVAAGVCVDGAFISDSNKPQPERITVGLRFRHFNDVHLSLATTTKSRIVESDGLEQRLRKAQRMAESSGAGKWYSSIKVFRRGTRAIGGWHGYEILARKPPQTGSTDAHEFAFTSHGEPNNPSRPVLELEMHTGVQNNRRSATEPTITDEEAIYLWDKIVSSIRLRPIVSEPMK